MGQVEDLRLFVQIVEQGSVSKAADKLNIAKSAVSRRLALLEDRYDAALIQRKLKLEGKAELGLKLRSVFGI